MTRDHKPDASLVHCVFTAHTREELEEDAFFRMLGQYRADSVAAEVTGVTLYEGGNAFLVLEGRKEAVDELYRTLDLASLSRRVVKIMEEPIAERAFGEWSLAYGEISKRTFQNAREGTFFAAGGEFSRIPPGRAKNLIGDFARGKWRLASKR